MVFDSIDYPKQQVIDSIEVNFTSGSNPSLYHYYEQDKIWKLMMRVVEDDQFMKLIIFNNDYLKIAPVHTVCSYFIDHKDNLSNYEKNSIGRILKFVFIGLGYKSSVRVYKKAHSINYAKFFNK